MSGHGQVIGTNVDALGAGHAIYLCLIPEQSRLHVTSGVDGSNGAVHAEAEVQ